MLFRSANGLSPLLWAAGIGSPETVKFLLERKANISLAKFNTDQLVSGEFML